MFFLFLFFKLLGYLLVLEEVKFLELAPFLSVYKVYFIFCLCFYCLLDDRFIESWSIFWFCRLFLNFLKFRTNLSNIFLRFALLTLFLLYITLLWKIYIELVIILNFVLLFFLFLTLIRNIVKFKYWCLFLPSKNRWISHRIKSRKPRFSQPWFISWRLFIRYLLFFLYFL